MELPDRLHQVTSQFVMCVCVLTNYKQSFQVLFFLQHRDWIFPSWRSHAPTRFFLRWTHARTRRFRAWLVRSSFACRPGSSLFMTAGRFSPGRPDKLSWKRLKISSGEKRGETMMQLSDYLLLEWFLGEAESFKFRPESTSTESGCVQRVDPI